MELTIKGSPQEIKELLQVIQGNKEQTKESYLAELLEDFKTAESKVAKMKSEYESKYPKIN